MDPQLWDFLISMSATVCSQNLCGFLSGVVTDHCRESVDVYAFCRQPVAEQVKEVILDAQDGQLVGACQEERTSVLSSANSQHVHLPCPLFCVATSARWDRALGLHRAVGTVRHHEVT